MIATRAIVRRAALLAIILGTLLGHAACGGRVDDDRVDAGEELPKQAVASAPDCTSASEHPFRTRNVLNGSRSCVELCDCKLVCPQLVDAYYYESVSCHPVVGAMGTDDLECDYTPRACGAEH